MSKVFGTNERLVVERKVDSEGELEVSMAVYSSDDESTCTWINKQMASELIEHLQRVFKI